MNLEKQKFGKLTVLEKDMQKGNANHPYWVCKCDCGNIKSIRQDVLTNGTTKSCGCYAKEQARKRIQDLKLPGHNFEDLSGKKFGKLTVLNLEKKEYYKNRGCNILYKCKCDCGNEIIVNAGNLKSLHTTSCGCKKESSGTIILTDILKKLNITFEKEKIFPDCLSDKNYPLRMDFYLPEYNTVIEIDGKQHFYKEPNGYFDEEKINRIKILDTIKNNYCNDKNIKMIRIPFTEWKKLDSKYVLTKIKN